MYDQQMRNDFKEAKQSVVAWLLMASFLYYVRPTFTPILEDSTFDKACKWLLDNYDSVEHRYKHLVSKDDLRAGSLYSLGSHQYPIPLVRLAELISEGNYKFKEVGDVE